MAKEIKSRIISKHDIEANWLQAVNFIPKKGETIVYDVDDNYDYERLKLGDGVTKVNELPFVHEQADWNQTDSMKADYIKNKPENLAYLNTTSNETITDPDNPGGTSIDVTAEVGQTIIVKEVDENGKPTKWESADYQPRTHWTEMVEILPETTITLDEGQLEVENSPYELETGKTYRITWDGEMHEVKAQLFTTDGQQYVFVGNGSALGLDDTGEPFIIGYIPINKVMQILSMDVSATTATVKVEGEFYNPIPTGYLSNAFPYYIEVTGSGTTDDPYVCNETVSSIQKMVSSNRHIVLKESFNYSYGFNCLYYTLATYGEVDNHVLIGFYQMSPVNDAAAAAWSDGRFWLYSQDGSTFSVTKSYPLAG